MMHSIASILWASMSAVAWADELPKLELHVDCAAAPGGNGSESSPYATIGAGLAAGKPLAATHAVVVPVKPGVCGSEVFPIRLDYPVTVRGSRVGDFDDEGLPLGTQSVDTLVERTSGASVLFRVTSDDVTITRLSIDGKVPAGTGTGPVAIDVLSADRVTVKEVRVVNAGAAIVMTASSGLVEANWFGSVGSALSFVGGDPAPTVKAEGNRIVQCSGGAIAVIGASALGTAIHVELEGNDLHTTFANTGPSNPYGIRFNLFTPASASLSGNIDAEVEGNHVGGTFRYGLFVNAGMASLRADGQHYTGTFRLEAKDNTIDDIVTASETLISFTNSRAVENPCELDPESVRGPDCPTLGPPTGPPYTHWDYLFGSSYEIEQSGEFDGQPIDHPATHPITGEDLGNLLVIDDEEVPHGTFVVVP